MSSLDYLPISDENTKVDHNIQISSSINDIICKPLQDVSNIGLERCANCGKDVNNVNTCNKCKKAIYCNAACKKKHRHKHKKDCDEHIRRIAEHAAKLHDIELFKQPRPKEDCPICFIRLPTFYSGAKYYACCGKVICSGCRHAPLYDHQGNKVNNQKCAFCRVPYAKTDEEVNKREMKRVEAGDPIAIHNLGVCYRDGIYGCEKDHTKALELFHRSGELGNTWAYLGIANAYFEGRGVDVDKKKAISYYELAAIGGDEMSRYNLGRAEIEAGNMDRATKHFMIAIRDGDAPSLKEVQLLYSNGHVTKDNYTEALRSYQAYLGEIKSKQRDEAAAFDSKAYRYY